MLIIVSEPIQMHLESLTERSRAFSDATHLPNSCRQITNLRDHIVNCFEIHVRVYACLGLLLLCVCLIVLPSCYVLVGFSN